LGWHSTRVCVDSGRMSTGTVRRRSAQLNRLFEGPLPDFRSFPLNPFNSVFTILWGVSARFAKPDR
jgi:hypothetical protein